MRWGGGGVSSNAVSPNEVTEEIRNFTVSGTVSGLLGEKIVLLNNGADELTVADDGEFKFATSVTAGSKYDVTIKTQPTGFSKCSLEGNASGTIAANVADVKVVCKPVATVSSINPAPAITGAIVDTLAIDSKGEYLYLPSSNGGAIINSIKLSDNSLRSTSLITDTYIQGGMVIKTNGDLYFAGVSAPPALAQLGFFVNKSNTSSVVSPSGSVFSSATIATDASGGINFVGGMALSKDEKTLYVLNPGALKQDDKILRIDVAGASSSVAPVKTNIPIPHSSSGIALDAQNNIYIANSDANNIIKISALDGTADIFAGSPVGAKGSVDGKGTAASFNQPTKIAFDYKSEFLYVADTKNNMIRRISKKGEVSTVAGTTTAGTQDGDRAKATFAEPIGIAVDPVRPGVLYVTDGIFVGNVRKIEAK